MKKIALVWLLVHGSVYGSACTMKDPLEEVDTSDRKAPIEGQNPSVLSCLQKNRQRDDGAHNMLDCCGVSVPVYSKDGCDVAHIATGVAAVLCVARLCLCMP